MSQRSNQVIRQSQENSTPETLSTVFDTGPEFDTSSTDPVVDGDEFCRREKDQCLYELRRAIWECRLFAQSLLHVDDAFSPPMKAGDNCITSGAEPECSELSNVLNLIGCAVRSKEDQVGLSGNLVFSPYRCFVEDVINENQICLYEVGIAEQQGTDYTSSPQPDLCISGSSSHSQRPALQRKHVSLFQLEVLVENGEDQDIILEQAALHARACFAVRPHRSSFIAITFDRWLLNVRFLLFHRGGAISSPRMCLLNPRGWDDFVRHSCGLFSSKFIQAGMNLSRSRRFIFIRARVSGEAQPQYIVLYVRQAISQQLCLRGRATLVEKLGVLSSANSENEARSQASELLQHRPPPDIIQLPDLHENYIMSHAKFLELAPADDDINVPVIDSTKELICRDLWVVKGSTSVQDYKHSMRNKFGVNSVIGFTRVEDTCKFSDDSLSLEPSNILPSPGGPQIRDIRIHVRSFSEVQGVRRLADAKTPRQFVTAVVHAMLGHFNLWNSQGILHCGINPDSILITDATPRDSISEITAASKLTACQGVLLGEDTGRSVHESLSIEGEIDTDGLDLLYYLPIRVLWAKLHNRPGNRDIWDDLESALWVMIFEYLKIVARVNPKFEYKPLLHYDEMFSTTDGSSILRAKHVIIVEWLLRDTAPGFGPFREFFTLWYKLLDDGSSDTLQSLRDFFERILSYVAREKGDWDSWEAFWEAGGGYEEAYFLQKLEAFNRWVGD